MRTYRVLDIFAGAGGLSLGFLQTKRFEIVAAFENNRAARETYIANHSQTTLFEDVLHARFEELSAAYGQFDVIIGGPPCQGFSNANRQHNQLINMNNQLIRTYVEFIKKLNPKAFLLENVKMLSSQTHRFFYTAQDPEEVRGYDSFKKEEVHVYHGDREIPFEDLVNKNKIIWPDFSITTDMHVLVRELKRKLAKDLVQAVDIIPLCEIVDSFISCLDEGRLKASLRLATSICQDEENSVEHGIETVIMIADALIKLEDISKNNIAVSEIKQEGKNLKFVVYSYTVIDYLLAELGKDYLMDKGVINSVDYGIPQNRERYIMLGVRKEHGIKPNLPVAHKKKTNVYDAIGDLYDVESTEKVEDEPIPLKQGRKFTALSSLRDNDLLFNHVVTKSSKTAKDRFAVIKQGMNFHSLGKEMITNYSNPKRTQNSIYLRLDETKPSATVTNVRKAMWIHPVHDRAISVREAARLQSFPDSFKFVGTKDQQYQQVGNAVPPMLAEALASSLLDSLDQINGADDKGEK